MGWTGDIQVFAPTACVNFDSRAFLANWLADLAIEQAADGQVPSTVPNVIQGHAFEYGGIDWAEASVATPFGLAGIRWDISRDGLTVRLIVPAGATGCFHSPHGWSLLDHGAATLGSGTHVLTLYRDNQA